MSEELQERASRRSSSRRIPKKTCSTQPMLDADGKVCPAPGLPYPPFLHFRMLDGTELLHRNAAIGRAGRCPHCFVDFLADAGLFHLYRNETHFCDFELDGPSDAVRRNGKDLIAALWSFGIPRVDPLHLFNEGGHA